MIDSVMIRDDVLYVTAGGEVYVRFIQPEDTLWDLYSHCLELEMMLEAGDYIPTHYFD